MTSHLTGSNVFAAAIVAGAGTVAVPGSQVDRTRTYTSSVSSFLDCDGMRGNVHGVVDSEYKIVLNRHRVNRNYHFGEEPGSSSCVAYSPGYIKHLTDTTPSKYRDGLPAAGEHYSFDSILRRLGQAMAYYTSSYVERANAAWLLNGVEPVIREVRATGRAYGFEGVYASVQATRGQDIHMTAIILYAAAGCGANIYTNEVYVRNGSWAAKLPSGSTLVAAVHATASMLIDLSALNGDASNALFHYIAGMHDICSVVGATDEGGFARDAIRKMPTCVPYGAIGGVCEQFAVLPGLPCAGRHPLSSYSAIVDSMLLASAALFAVSDPGCGKDNNIPVTSVIAPGGSWRNHQTVVTSTAAEVGAQVASRLGMGCGIMGDDCERAGMAFLAGACAVFENDANRHLNHEVVCPWYWIEPSAILADTATEVHHSRVCPILVEKRSASASLPLWGTHKVAVRDLGRTVSVGAEWVRPRDCGYWYLYSSNANALDGLAQVRIRETMGISRSCDDAQVRANCIAPGLPVVEGGVDQTGSLAGMMWTMGNNAIPPPSMACPTMKSFWQFDYDVNAGQGYFGAPMAMTSRFPGMDADVIMRVSRLSPSARPVQPTTHREFAGLRGAHVAAQLLIRRRHCAVGANATFDDMMAEIGAVVDRRKVQVEWDVGDVRAAAMAPIVYLDGDADLNSDIMAPVGMPEARSSVWQNRTDRNVGEADVVAQVRDPPNRVMMDIREVDELNVPRAAVLPAVVRNEAHEAEEAVFVAAPPAAPALGDPGARAGGGPVA